MRGRGDGGVSEKVHLSNLYLFNCYYSGVDYLALEFYSCACRQYVTQCVLDTIITQSRSHNFGKRVRAPTSNVETTLFTHACQPNVTFAYEFSGFRLVTFQNFSARAVAVAP